MLKRRKILAPKFLLLQHGCDRDKSRYSRQITRLDELREGDSVALDEGVAHCRYVVLVADSPKGATEPVQLVSLKIARNRKILFRGFRGYLRHSYQRARVDYCVTTPNASASILTSRMVFLRTSVKFSMANCFEVSSMFSFEQTSASFSCNCSLSVMIMRWLAACLALFSQFSKGSHYKVKLN